jgi:putative ABC transport system permease protein
MIERLRVDTSSAIRGLRTSPGTLTAALVMLAVAAGINLAMFGLIDRAILSPPAHIADPARVFTIAFEHDVDGERVLMSTRSYVTFEAIRDHTPAVSNAAAWQRTAVTAVVDGEQIQTQAMLVSGSYFPMLEARARIGRAIEMEDDRPPSGSPVAVLSHAFWRAAFSSNPNVLGRRLSIRGLAFDVIGVMPPGFSGHSSAQVDLWVPLHAGMRDTPGWDRDRYRNIVEMGVRLRAGETSAAVSTQSSAVAGQRVVLAPIGGATISPTEHTIAYWLAAVSILVFTIGLANTATLLVVRGARRRLESGIRVALGATRGRLLSQFVIEAAVLATVATGAALVLAYWFDEVVREVLLPSLTESTGLNLRMIGAATVAGLCTLIVATGVGAMHVRIVTRPESLSIAARSGRRATALLLVQTTLAVMLLAAAGMFARSLNTLATQDFGMRMDGVLVVEFERGVGSAALQDQLFKSALERVRTLPGVTMATPIQIVPFTGFQVPPISVPGLAQPPNAGGQLPFLTAATPELFEILGLQIVEGRRFTKADDSGPPVAIVNESMARGVWPGRSALGQCFRIGFDQSFNPSTESGPPTPPLSAPCREVVGVVRDVRQRSLVPSGNETRLMQYYVPFSQNLGPPPWAGPAPTIRGLMLRTTLGAETLAAPIRRLVLGGRSDLPFLQVRPYPQLLDRQMRPWRMGTTLLTLFAGLALVIAAVGLYAAFAHVVSERRREMAIRIAVGAVPRRVLVMIVREAAGLATIGVVCGCLAAIVGGRWIQSMLFGTTATDPVVLGSAAAVMLTVAASATYLPARSASRADPSALLRTE